MSRKSKVSTDLKSSIVREYLEGNTSFKKLSKKYNIPINTINCWVRKGRVNPASLIQQSKNKSYSKEFKLKLVNEYLRGNTSFAQLSSKYNVPSEATIYSWVMKYNNKEKFSSKNGAKYMNYTRKTTIEEREKIVIDCIANGKNYSEIAEKYKVNYQQLRNWVLKYEKLGKAGLEDRRGKRIGSITPRTEEENNKLLMAKKDARIKELEIELDIIKKLRELTKK